MTIDFPPSYQKKQAKPIKYRCDTCNRQDCAVRWKAVCWIHCREWAPPSERKEKPGG